MARPVGMRKCDVCYKFFRLGDYVSKATCQCHVLTTCKACMDAKDAIEASLLAVKHVDELHEANEFKNN